MTGWTSWPVCCGIELGHGFGHSIGAGQGTNAGVGWCSIQTSQADKQANNKHHSLTRTHAPHVGADINLLDFDKRAPLHLALEAQDLEMVEALIKRGADVNLGNQDFVTNVHFAAQR